MNKQLAAVALFCCATLRAHEIGTTRVAVLFQDGRTYNVEIVTDEPFFICAAQPDSRFIKSLAAFCASANTSASMTAAGKTTFRVVSGRSVE